MTGLIIVALLLVPSKIWGQLFWVGTSIIKRDWVKPYFWYGSWWSHRQTGVLSVLIMLVVLGSTGVVEAV